MAERVDKSGPAAQLPSLLPDTHASLQSITTLTLTAVQLPGGLPCSIFNLRHSLKTLKLGCCNLKTLPDEICWLTKLDKLLLPSNHLTELPVHIGYLHKLKVLSLSHNKLKALPPSIGALPSLTILGLAGNPLLQPPDAIREAGIRKIVPYLWTRIKWTDTLHRCLGREAHERVFTALVSAHRLCQSHGIPSLATELWMLIWSTYGIGGNDLGAAPCTLTACKSIPLSCWKMPDDPTAKGWPTLGEV